MRRASAKRRSRKRALRQRRELVEERHDHRRGNQQQKQLEHDHDRRCPNPPVWASPLDQLQHQRKQWKPEQHGEQKTFQTIKHPRLHGSRVETESVFEFELRVPREWQTDDA